MRSGAASAPTHGSRDSPTSRSKGVEAWLAFVQKQLAPYQGTQHHLGLPLLEFREGAVRARVSLRAEHFFGRTTPRTFTVWGHYDSTLEPDPDRSGFQLRTHRLDVLRHETRALQA